MIGAHRVGRRRRRDGDRGIHPGRKSVVEGKSGDLGGWRVIKETRKRNGRGRRNRGGFGGRGSVEQGTACRRAATSVFQARGGRRKTAGAGRDTRGRRAIA